MHNAIQYESMSLNAKRIQRLVPMVPLLDTYSQV